MKHVRKLGPEMKHHKSRNDDPDAIWYNEESHPLQPIQMSHERCTVAERRVLKHVDTGLPKREAGNSEREENSQP